MTHSLSLTILLSVQKMVTEQIATLNNVALHCIK